MTAITQGAHGTAVLNPDGTLTYTPSPGWVGTDSFTYTVTSGGQNETAVVTVNTAAIPMVTGERHNTGINSPTVAIAPIQSESALHVLLSVDDARNEISMRSGLGLFQTDHATAAELLGGLNFDGAFAAGVQDGPGSLSGRDFSPLHPLYRGVLDQPNALYIQHAVRHESLAMDNGLHVQTEVRASQLESAARNVRISSFNSATPGVVSLLDPFALGTPSFAAGMPAAGDAVTGKAAVSSLAAEDLYVTRMVEAPVADAILARVTDAGIAPTLQHRAAPGFSMQLHRVAAEMRPHAAQISLLKRTK